MSDYTEHLISMAGGDGETVDQLAAIEARANGLTDLCAEHMRQSIRHVQRNVDIDCNVHDDEATWDERVLDLANTRSRCGWQISADEIRKALKG